ncbi:MAG: hypothetical protein JNK02_08805 [Planctomycetes bacterium]|nr:hypothetical protein [Planctomycetota bacterium]
MGRTAFALALAVLGLVGLAARLAPAGQRLLESGARDLGGSRWVVDDPGTALHLRRIELALAEGRVPQRDPFLAHGESPEVPALPVFDALLAGFAQRWLASPDGDPALGGVDEGRLEAFAAGVGPLAYLLAFAALAWAAWIAARGARLPVLLAAAAFALAPAAVAAGEVGRLDAAAFALVLLALLVRGTQLALAAEDALSMILEALLGGVVAGLLAALSAAGALLALPTAAALLVRATRGPPAVRPIAIRAGLLFSLVAAFTSRLPLADGPWQQVPAGLVASWSLFASDVLLVSAAPFALLLLSAPRDAARKGRAFARVAALAAMLALLVYELPRAWAAGSGPLEAWWSARALTRGQDGTNLDLGLVLLGGAALVAASWATARRRDGASLHLAALAVVALLVAVAEPQASPLAVAVCALALAGALPALCAERGQAAWLGVGTAGLLVVLLARGGPTPAERDELREAIAGLRWIRREVAAGGPFNSSSASSTWGILADPRLGELVAYHARRPVLASRASCFALPDGYAEAAELAASRDGARIAARMQAQRLSVALAAPVLARGAGLLGADGVEAAREGRVPIPGATQLLPREAPARPDADRPPSAPPLAAWFLEGAATPRGPALVPPR